MRSAWFEYVAKVRKKLQRNNKKKTVSHKEAMKVASVNWPKEKVKLQRKIAREKKKQEKLNKENPEPAKEHSCQLTV